MNEKEIKAAAMSFDEFRDEPHAIAMALLDARAEREKADKALTHALRSVVAALDDFDALLDEVESERIRAFDLSDDLREATAERDALRKVDDAMVGRFLRAYAECEGERPQTFTHWIGVRAALNAALAVQPTTEGM